MDLQITDIFNDSEHVDGWFTLRNERVVHSDGGIRGLNCGLDTGVPPDEIKRNHDLVCRKLGISRNKVAFAQQVHGSHIERIGQPGKIPEADALITSIPGITLAIQVADCPAVLLTDVGNRIIAAVHAGWRGAVAGILPETIRKMQDEGGAVSSQMMACICPSISLDYFEVGTEVAVLFPDIFVDTSSYSKPHVDLKGFLRHQLLEAGIPDDQVVVDRGCTFRDKIDYYSYRREGKRAGRMLAMIRMRESDDA